MAALLHARGNVALHYQSRGIPFQECLSQITLCFAPYAAHVLNGVPQFISLQEGLRPHWIDMVNFFNPTTIIWRYVIIFDRHLRATTWTAENMAASNAAFFTGQGWNGSEVFMVLSKSWIIRSPSGTNITLLSVSAIGTMVVFIQGVQALYESVFQIKTGVPLIQGLGGIFLPLAVFGLLRTFPAMWLSNEFAYKVLAPDSREARELEAYWVDEGIIAMGNNFNLSILITHFLYQIMVVATLGLFATYIFLGRADTTVIPCIGSWWYTIYTLSWYSAVVAVIIINAIETRRASCGIYTTYPSSAGLDAKMCAEFAGS